MKKKWYIFFMLLSVLTVFLNCENLLNDVWNELYDPSYHKFLIGGMQNIYNGEVDVPDKIFRLNPNGSIDYSFNNDGTGADDTVMCIVRQSDGKIIIGGMMTTYNGQSVPYGICRLDADGTLDTSFSEGGTGFSGGSPNTRIIKIVVLPDDTLLVGGQFTDYNGIDVPDCLCRLNSDGSVYTSFSGGTGFSHSSGDTRINTIILMDDNKALVGGQFTHYNASDTPNNIIRIGIDGTWDSTFNESAFGSNGTISAILPLSNGNIIIGGAFANYNGVDVPDRLCRLKSDGTPDTTFNSSGTGFDAGVQAVLKQNNGKLIVAGSMTTYNGSAISQYFCRLNTDGSYDSTFNSGGTGFDVMVWDAVLQPDGKILAGGNFNTYNGVDIPNRLARFNEDGSWDTFFNNGGSGGAGSIITVFFLP